jgi:hypothetical protein
VAGGLDALPLFKAPEKQSNWVSLVSIDLNLSSKLEDCEGVTTGGVG